MPGRASELGCDCEQLVTAAATVCSDDDVSASEPQSHRAVRLQQTLSNEECVDAGRVWETVCVCARGLGNTCYSLCVCL